MRVISRWTEDGVEVFDAELTPVRVFPVPAEPPVEEHAVAFSRDRLVYVTGAAVICVDARGRQSWRFPSPAAAGCAWSGDDTLVWVYLANTGTGAAEPDQWLALDASTGEIRVRHELATAGLGGRQFAFPDGRHMLLEVSEGRNGCTAFRGGPDGELHTYSWDGLSVIDVSPRGRRVMTVSLSQEEVAFHDLLGGEATITLRAEALGTGQLEWAGGYLDEETAIVVLSGERDEEPWWRHFRVDVHTGEVLGDLGIVTVDEYDLQPLGDGTYVITDTDETLRRM